MYVPRELVTSLAFVTLTGRAPQVLLAFYSKRQVVKVKRTGPRGERWRDLNDGQINFPYREARDTYGLTLRIFVRALDQLVEHGFIDVTRTGGGLEGDCSEYSISNRWRTFGTTKFVKRERQKGRKWPNWKPHPRATHINVSAPAHTNVSAPTTDVSGSGQKSPPRRTHKCEHSIESPEGRTKQTDSGALDSSVSFSSVVVDVQSLGCGEKSAAPVHTHPDGPLARVRKALDEYTGDKKSDAVLLLVSAGIDQRSALALSKRFDARRIRSMVVYAVRQNPVKLAGYVRDGLEKGWGVERADGLGSGKAKRGA